MLRRSITRDTKKRPASSLELIGHLVDPGLDASFILFAAGSPRSARGADDLVAYLDRKRPLIGYDVGEVDQPKRWIGLQPLDQRAGGGRNVRAV